MKIFRSAWSASKEVEAQELRIGFFFRLPREIGGA
jgi:hypothetical protein